MVSPEILFQGTLLSSTPTPNQSVTTTSKTKDQALPGCLLTRVRELWWLLRPRERAPPVWRPLHCWVSVLPVLPPTLPLPHFLWLSEANCSIGSSPPCRLFACTLVILSRSAFWYLFTHPWFLFINWPLSYCCPNPCNSCCGLVLLYSQPTATFTTNTSSF